jgi:Zn-finger protein
MNCDKCPYKEEVERLKEILEQLRQMLKDQRDEMEEKLSDDLQNNGFFVNGERNGD